jgi:transposase InsO family protein
MLKVVALGQRQVRRRAVQRLKCLTIVDDYTKEAIDILIDHVISGE